MRLYLATLLVLNVFFAVQRVLNHDFGALTVLHLVAIVVLIIDIRLLNERR
jgi:hypothetical protein